MTLLLRTSIVIAVLVVSTSAAPPSNYIKASDHEKNSPSYRYTYVIENYLGDEHDKTKSPESEHTTERYYVNIKRSMTNVKYIADEGGYYSFIWYNLGNNYSNSNTSFKIGEKSVANLPNKSIVQPTTEFLHPGDRMQLLQIIQPYHRSKENTKESDIFIVQSNKTWIPDNFTDDIIVTDILSNTATINLLNASYINNIPQQKLNEEKSFSNKKSYLGKGNQLSTVYPKSNLVSSLANDLPFAASEEEQLIIDNAGSFGERLHVQSKDTSISSVTKRTVDPILSHSDISLPSSTIQSENYFNDNFHKNNEKPYLPDIIPGLGAYSSIVFPLVDNTVTANSIESENTKSHESNTIENVGWKTYSTSSSHITGSNFGTTRNPMTTNYVPKSSFSSIPKIIRISSDKKREYAFSKPIVVPDVPKESPFQYSTIFDCEDALSSTPDPMLSRKGISSDTTSSYILNPIQAGVALVNAGKTHLIVNHATVKKLKPAPVREKIQETFLPNTIHLQEKNYLGLYTAFNGEQNINQTDHILGIQKPIQRNYDNFAQDKQFFEKSTVFPGIKYVDRQESIATFNEPQKQLYLNSSAEINFKQPNSSQIDSEILPKVYEFTDIYPKELSGEKPLYVIPPATYIIEDSSILKNSLLQEKIPQYQGDISDTHSKIILDEDQAKSEAQNGGNTKPFRSLDVDISALYNTKILHEQQHVIDKEPEDNFEISSEKTLRLSHMNPIEKIMGKKVPYPNEKIIGKKIPISQVYPVAIQVPAPQSIPIHIEKIVERKIPIPINIPKQIHIPVTIEKIIEKPIHIPINVEKIIETKVPVPQLYPVELEKIVEQKIPFPIEKSKYIEKSVTLQAPYGVKYGVSYQQIMKPQNHGLYSPQLNKLASLYALSLSSKTSIGNTSNNNSKNINDVSVNKLNHSQSFQGYIYEKPPISFNEGKENIEKHQFQNSKIPTKIYTYNSYIPTYSLSNAILHRRYIDMQRLNKPERDDYFGPVPRPQHLQRHFGFQSKVFSSYPITVDRTQNSRKSRNYEHIRYPKGNFRQSKIEYGFKPPMVPSVQYDEETASKVQR